MRRVPGGVAIVVAVCALATAATATAKSTLYQLGSNSVSARGINADGTLTPLTGSPFLTGSVGTDSVVITPDGSKLFVANQISDDISRFQVNADGTLTSFGAPTPTTLPNPLTLTVTPDGRFLYVVTGNSITAYSIGSTGGLTTIAGSPFTHASLNGPRVPSVSPDGTALFVPNNGGTSVTSFQIDANGALAFADTEPTGGTGVVYSAVTADGRRLYVNNWFSNTIAGYDVGAGAALTPITGSPFATGANTNPMGLRPSLSGQRLYAALIHDSAEQIGVFAIAGNGALSPVPGGAVPSGVLDPTFPIQTPDGRHLYAGAVSGGANTAGFNISDTGALTPIPGSPFVSGVGGSNFQAVAVTPNQGPTAALAVNVTNRDARTADFDASASTDADGSITTYSFDFGDGESQTGPSPTASHTYAAPGVYTATMTVTDNEGCSTAFVGTGQTASCNGGPKATAQGDADVTPTPEPPAVPDTDPPGLTVSGRRKQELGSSVFVKAGCDEPCTATGTGKLNVRSPGAGKQTVRFKLKPKTKALAAGATTKLKLKIPRKARGAAGRALLGDGAAKAKIKVSAADAAGNTAGGKRSVRLTR